MRLLQQVGGKLQDVRHSLTDHICWWWLGEQQLYLQLMLGCLDLLEQVCGLVT